MCLSHGYGYTPLLFVMIKFGINTLGTEAAKRMYKDFLSPPPRFQNGGRMFVFLKSYRLALADSQGI